MIVMPTIYITLYDILTHNDLGGGTCYGIASSTTYNIIHRAFRRCLSRAQAEGFVRFRPPDADVLAHSQ
ncbi:MAG: hypothetical protein PUD88_00235 [Prevotellaceae bacterium]|nr:hypothetical protein [Prevotellaceae bacterium]